MTSIFTDKDLEASTSKNFSIFAVIGTTVLVTLFIYEEGNKLFDFKKFNPNGINTIIFLFFLLVCIFWWLKLIDRKAQIKIDSEGLWIRKTIVPFSGLQLIRWTEIYFFYLLEKTQKGITGHYLVIRRLNTEKEIKIELSGLDKSMGRILSIVRNYADKYSIEDLGKQFD